MFSQPSTVQIHEKNIVDIAKNVMKIPGWKCEWGSALSGSGSECRVILVSWNAYLQHLLCHCKHVKLNDRKKHPCRLPRCNVPQDVAFNSFEDLAKHIKSSHMNRVSLACPVSGCDALFSRSAALDAHFSEIHREIIGLPISSPLLLPLWTPSPLTTWQPPTLPAHLLPAEVLVGTCGGNWKTTNGVRHAALPAHAQFLLLSPRKHQKPGSLSLGGRKSPQNMFFVDLKKESDKQGLWLGDLRANCLIRQKGSHIDLSRPQNMFPPEASIHKRHPLAQTIGYKVFEQRLEGVESEEQIPMVSDM